MSFTETYLSSEEYDKDDDCVNEFWKLFCFIFVISAYLDNTLTTAPLLLHIYGVAAWHFVFIFDFWHSFCIDGFWIELV